MQCGTLLNVFILVVLVLSLTPKHSNCADVIDVHVTNGSDISLSCFLRNSSNITWTKGNENIVNTSGSLELNTDDQFRLQIYRISSPSIFKCKSLFHTNKTLSNSSFTSFSVSFNITIIDKMPLIINEGKSQLFTCPGALSSVSWKIGETFSEKPNLTLNVQRDTHSIKCRGLVIGNNGQANVTQIIKLDVKYVPDNITLQLLQNSNILNGTLKIVCIANGNPAPKTFTWYKNRHEFLQNNSGIFKKPSLEYSDYGNYICSPEFTNRNKSIFILVKGPPSQTQNLRLLQTARTKTSLGVSWDAPQYNGTAAILQYEVYIRMKPNILPMQFSRQNTTNKSYTATGLRSGTKYQFMVRAFNIFGPSKWSMIMDNTLQDNKKPTAFDVKRVNYTNVMRAVWTKPDEELEAGVRYCYEFCYKEKDATTGTSLQCYNTSKLIWTTKPLKEYKEYYFKVRACKVKKGKECSHYTDKVKKTGPERPKKLDRLNATSIGTTKLNITWETNKTYTHSVEYHVKICVANMLSKKWTTYMYDLYVTSKTFLLLQDLSPNTTYTIQVHAEIKTKDDIREVSGEATEITVTTTIAVIKLPTTQSTEVSTTTNKGDTNESNGDSLMNVVIVLATFAFIAAIVASIFFFLYVRPASPNCYRLLFARRRSTFTCVSIENITEASPPTSSRQRLTSFSSFRKQAICKSDPIQTSAFQGHVKRLHCDSDYLFSLEFEAIGCKKYLKEKDKKVETTHLEAKKSANKSKNRYPDIIPYDHSRVVLTELDDDPDSSYINANYIHSYHRERAYIASQGPLDTTISDFWRMIWETNSRVVAMVTNLLERSKVKCVKYWPDKGSADYGLMRITMLNEESFASYVVRSFSIEPVPDQTHYIMINGNGKSRVIQQFHYTEWPDHDVPIHPAAILRYIRKSKAANPPGAGPIVVHCSAGIGRSGTYIVIDSMMERIDDDKTVDAFNFLNHIRTQRNFLVQEERQYTFVHDALLEYISFGDSNIPMQDFHNHVQSLLLIVQSQDTKKTGLTNEFEDVDCTKIMEKHKWAAKKSCNTLKNRRNDVLPVDRTRVKLPPILGTQGADYINASYIDGFSKKKEYIATQAPMLTTRECFWRMVWTMKSNILVMLLDDEECKKDDYFADLPTADEEVTCGKFEIQLESEENISDHVTVRKLRLFSETDSSDGHEITHYHYRHWSPDSFPDDKTSVITFIENVRDHKIAKNEKTPITVYCDFGVGRTGIFCLLSTLFDQLEKEESVDVYQTAKLCRLQRPKLIETEEQYKFCYDILSQLVSTKLASLPAQPAGSNNPDVLETPEKTDIESAIDSPEKPAMDNPVISGNDKPDTETPEKPSVESGNDSPEKLGIDNPGKSCNDEPDISGTNDAEAAGSKEPLLSSNDNQDCHSEVSKRGEQTNYDETSKGDFLL